MEHHSRRSVLLQIAAYSLLILGYGLALLDKLLDLVPQKLATRVVEAEGHAAGHASASAYSLAAETGIFTLTGGDASMRVSGAPTV